jgi:hypothetical protein
MNWMIRLGTWWQDRAKRTEKALRCDVNARFDLIEQKLSKPSGIEKEVALLKIRMDRLELYTGLKREPVAVTLPGEARIS